MFDSLKNMDAKEIELPETMFIRDIATRVFQGIIIQTLAKISGIGLLEGNLFDNLLGRDIESVKGVYVEQDAKKHSVDVRVEINIVYGISIPEKSEEIHSRLVEEISRWTGLHVASIHVIFKGLIHSQSKEGGGLLSKNLEKAEEFEEAF